MSGRYLALLRGINVGGKNVIRKDDLRSCFEELGFQNVTTYIQSGNVLFGAATSDVARLCDQVEAGLARRFGYDVRAVVLSHGDYRAAVRAAHDSWGVTEGYRHDALFLLPGVASDELLASLPPLRRELEQATAAPGVIFWSVERAKVTRSSFTRLPGIPAYQQVTIRNHNTVRRLEQLFDG